MVFTIEKFCCLSLKFGSNIVAICGVLLSFFANFDHGIVGSILFRNIALGLCMLYFGSSILLLIGVNKVSTLMNNINT